MDIEIANRLAELRKKKGLSQEELADKLGLSRQAVSKWERAESSPDTDNLILLAKLYDVSLDELLKTDKPVDDIIRDNKENSEEDNQQKKKDKVIINKNGIFIEDDDTTVSISHNGIHIKEHGEECNVNKPKSILISTSYGVSLLCALISYIIIGCLLTGPTPSGISNSGWSVGWILFIAAFVPSSIIEAIALKRIDKVNFTFTGLSVYLFLGMMYKIKT